MNTLTKHALSWATTKSLPDERFLRHLDGLFVLAIVAFVMSTALAVVR